MTHKSPVVTLNNGMEMPILGLGVYRTPPEQTVYSIEVAFAQGYRLIDTAAVYFNERQVGEGIRRSGLDRSEVFLTTKLWISDYGYEQALRAFEVSRKKLDVEYVDLYLMHWPVPSDFSATIESYRAAEKLLADGLVRAIGVSNFSPQHLNDLASRTNIVPAVNQVELHPYFTQGELREVHSRLGIVTQAWSPLGGVNVYSAKDPSTAKNPLTDPVITNLAEKHGKTPAQVVLRWHIEHGVSAIPKSVRPERIAENINVFDFALSGDEIASVDALDTGKRGGPDPQVFDSSVYSVKIED